MGEWEGRKGKAVNELGMVFVCFRSSCFNLLFFL